MLKLEVVGKLSRLFLDASGLDLLSFGCTDH